MASIFDYYNDFAESVGESRRGKSARDELIEQLGKIDEEGKPSFDGGATLPEAPAYERMEYAPPTDEEIAKTAEDSLAEYRQTSVEQIEAETEAARLAKEAQRQAAAESAAKRYAAIAGEYDKAAEAFSDDVLKRGLARSSIAVNKSAELADGKAAALAQSAADAENEAKTIDGEIAALEVSRQKALDSFNIAYAAKVTEKIAELTETRDKKAAEALKYNNSLSEKENKEALERAETLSGLYSEYLKQQETEQKLGMHEEAEQRRNAARYEAVRSYLLSLSGAEAAAAVRTDPVVRDSLTDYYYYSLYNEFCA